MKQSMRRYCIIVVAAIAGMAGSGWAQTVVQEFYIPMPEAQIRSSFLTLAPATGPIMDSVASIVVGTAGAKIVYDQWEDGYEVDINNPVQASTRIWGDSNDANGIPPFYAHDTNFAAGSVIALRNLVTLPRNPATILFDGRDRVGSTKGIVMSRSAWATSPGSVLADAIEMNATIDWGTSYTMPVGEDVIYPAPLTSSMFEIASLFVMAAQNGTVVNIDTNGNGTTDVIVPLNQGENYYLLRGINKGATVVASKPVQVNLLTGDIGANYESRWFTIAPTDQWGNSYYSPVGTATDGDSTFIFLYNPGVTSNTIFYETRLGTNSFSIPPTNTYRFLMPQDSGAHFLSATNKPFFAVGTVGANPAANNVHDWGFSLVPEGNLTTLAMVGWGPGSSDGSQNGSPVWVTAVKSTRIYVDYNGDKAGSRTDPSGQKYDEHYDLVPLEVKRLYDPDKDQTGMRVYTLDGTLLTAAWGQDPAVAGPGNPYLDVGTTIPAFPVPVIRKSSTIYTDTAPSNSLNVGDTLEYAITLDNNSLIALGNVFVVDALPSQLSYVTNSTSRDGEAIADKKDPATLFPLDESGIIIPIIPRGQSTMIKYRVIVDASGSIINGAGTAYPGVTDTNELVVPGPAGHTNCAIIFCDTNGADRTQYNPNEGIYVTVTNASANLNASSNETVTVSVQDTNTGDFEYLVLTETGPNTGIFRNVTPLPSSTTGGLSSSDGTLNALPGDNLVTRYNDPVYFDTCSDTATIPAVFSGQFKQLYLSSDGSVTQNLDRIDPVATLDGLVSQTMLLSSTNGTIVFDAASNGGTNETATAPGTPIQFVSVTHTTGTGYNRYMLVGVGLENDGTPASETFTNTAIAYIVGSVTQQLTRVFYRISAQEASAELWALKDPVSGTGRVRLSITDSTTALVQDAVAVGVMTFSGVNQLVPTGIVVSAVGNTPTTVASLTVSSALGELVCDMIGMDDSRTITANSTQTDRANVAYGSAVGDGVRAGMSTKPGAASVDMIWTNTSGTADAWAHIGIPLKPGPLVVSFTQSVALAESLIIPSGGIITAQTYYAIASGTMPVNPSMTAVLKIGASVLATSTNAVANVSSSNVTFTFPISSTVTAAAGQSVYMDFFSSQTGVTFRLEYDSTNKPSRIVLPTTTVIHMDSLGVFDAPYPGGVSVSGAANNGDTLYVRTTIGDPFGSNDITGVALTITGTGVVGNISATLSNAHVVASTASTKTYEYVWRTGLPVGPYTIIATGKEGYENAITSSKSTLVTLSFLDLGTPSTTEFTTGTNGLHTLTYGTNETVCIRVTDIDQNMDSSTIETVQVTVVSSIGGDTELVTLYETGTNTGVFASGIPASSTVAGTSSNGTIYAVAGDVLTVIYIDPNDSSDTSSDTATVPPPAGTNGLLMTKTVVTPTDGQAMVGETIQYLLNVVNSGSTTQNSVQVRDTYPTASLSYVSATISPTNPVVSGSLVWTNVGPLLPGQSTSITVDFQALAIANKATNTAIASGTGASSTGKVSTLITRPLISLVKTLVSPVPPANKGDTVVFNIAISNMGNTVIATLPVEDTYSGASFIYSNAVPAPNSVAYGSLLWTNLAPAGGFAVGAATNIVVTLTSVGAGNPANNNADISFAVDVNGDPVPPVTSSTGLVVRAATISGYVYNDVNTNGAFGGDAAFPGVTVSLYTDPNGDGDPVDGSLVAIETTLASGYYEFLNLSTGRYVVVETDSLGYQSVADTAGTNDNRIATNTTSFVAYTNNNFLDTLSPASSYGMISGQVRVDTNGNAALADVEPGLGGVTIDLYTDPNGDGNPADGVLFSTTVTSNSGTIGAYAFPNTPPGNYVVVETDLAGYLSTADRTGANNNWVTVSLASSSTNSANDFLDAQPGVIGDFVWRDTNLNGQQDGGEPGISNVVVTLYDSLTNVVNVTTSDVNGAYRFSNVTPGIHWVGFGTPAGTVFTVPTNGASATDSDVLGTNGWTGPFVLMSGSTNLTSDAGLFGAIPGLDLVKTAASAGDGGILVTNVGANVLYSYRVINTGNTYIVSMTVTDDVLGVVGTLTGPLAPGSTNTLTATHSNMVSDVTNIGTASGTPASSNGTPLMGLTVVTDTDSAAVDVVSPGFTVVKTLSAPTNRPAIAGETMTFSITVANTGDVTLVEVPVKDLFNQVHQTYLSALPEPDSTTVNSLIWTNLGPLTAGASTNLTVVFRAKGYTSPGYDTNGVVVTPTTPTNMPQVSPATNGAPYQIDNVASISGSVRRDIDGSGDIFDPANSNGIAGVQIVLSTTNGVPVATNFTDETGGYSFTNLVPGTYLVVETDPAGYVSTSTNIWDVSVSSGSGLSGYDFLDTLATAPAIAVVKTAGTAPEGGISYVLANTPVTYTYAVSNSGGCWLGPVTVNDNKLGLIGMITLLPMGGATNITLTTNIFLDVTNVAVAAGTPVETNGVSLGYPDVAATNDAIVDVVSPGFTVVKTLTSPTNRPAIAGDPMTFTIRVANTGDVTLVEVRVTDVFNNIHQTYLSALPAPDSTTANSLVWTNVGPLVAGASTNLTVIFTAKGYTSPGYDTNTVVVLSTTPTNVPSVSPITNGAPYQIDNVASISGSVRRDIDGLGDLFDPANSNGIAGVQIVLSTTNGVPVATNFTDETGGYSFTNLVPGTYRVVETDPAGYVSTSTNIWDVSVSSGSGLSGIDFLDTLASAPAITVVKTAGTTPEGGIRYVLADTPVTYTYAVSNSGGCWLGPVTVNDNKLGLIGTIALFPVGASTNIELTTNIFLDVTNVAVAAGTPVETNGIPLGYPDVAATNDAVVDVVAPGFTVEKVLTAPTNRPAIIGETLTFTITVANTGDVTLVTVPVTDVFDPSLLSFVSAAPAPDQTNASSLVWNNMGSLAAGSSTNLAVVFNAVGFTSPSFGTNVATAAPTTPPGNPPVTAMTNSVPYPIDAPAIIGGFVLLDHDGNGTNDLADTNGIAGVQVVLFNTNGVALATNTTGASGGYVFSNLVPGVYGVVETDLPSYDSTTTNALEVSVISGGNSASNNFLDVQGAGIQLVKTAGNALEGVTKYVIAPADVGYQYQVINVGGTYLGSLVVTDNVLGVVANFAGPVAPGATNIFYATNLAVSVDVTNIAVVTATPVSGGGVPLGSPAVSSTNDAIVQVLHPPLVKLIKTAEQAADGDLLYVWRGTNVVYTYAVINCGNAYLTNLVVSDDILGPVGTLSGTMAPGVTNYLYATNVAVSNFVVNVGVVSGQVALASGMVVPDFEPVTDTDTAVVDPVTPEVRLIKRAGNANDGEIEYVTSGSNVVYTYVVINTGDTTLTNVDVVDDVLGAVTNVALINSKETNTYYLTAVNVTNSVVNHAVVVGWPTNVAGSVTDDHYAYVEVVAPRVELIKTADSAPDGGVDYVLSNQVVTFTYTVINRGDTYLSSMTVTDDVLGAIGVIAGPVAPGVTNRLYKTAISASVTNIGTCVAQVTFNDGVPIPDIGDVSNSDDAIVQVVNPEIGLTKTADAATVTNGQSVTYTFAVTNSGDVAFTNVVVNDQTFGVSWTLGALGVGGFTNVSFTTNLTADTTNTAIAVGEPGVVGPVTNAAQEEVDVVYPAIGLVKTASLTTVTNGQSVTYTFAVTNSGDVAFTNVVVNDQTFGVSWTLGGLSVGGFTNVSFTTNLTADTTNTAIAVGEPGVVGPVTNAAQEEVDVVYPAIGLVKTASAGFVTNGQSVTYTFAVTNSGDVAFTNVVVNDQTFGVSWTLGALGVGGFTNVSFTTNLTADTTNTAIAVGQPGVVGPVTNAAQEEVDVVNPVIGLVKTASLTTVTNGQSVTYTFAVTNSGDVAFTNVVVNDQTFGVSWTLGALGVGGFTNVSFTTNLTADTTNTAIAVGEPGVVGPVTNAAQEEVDVVNPAIGLVKTASLTTVTNGQSVTYTFAVTNSGDVAFTNVVVNDQTFGVSWTLGALGVGGFTNVTFTTNLTADTTNTAIAVGQPGVVGPVTNAAQEEVDVVNPAIGLVKTASLTTVTNGQSVTYTFAVTNSGDVAFTNVVVNDQTFGVSWTLGALGVGGFTNVSFTTNLTADTTNTAIAVGEPGVVGPVTNAAQASVDVVHPGYVLTKTVISPTNRPPLPGETLTFGITIANTGDVALVTVPVTDVFNTNTLSFLSASPSATLAGNTVIWTNVGSVAQASVTNLSVTFTAIAATSPASDTNGVIVAPTTATNHPSIEPQTNGVPYQIDAPATISGSVLNDINGNGVVDASDTNGIAGSTVVLVDSNGTVVATTVVDATGAYSFTNLAPAAYTVVETNLSGFYSTGDQVGANDDQIPVTVVSGQTSGGNLFLDTAPATISGSVLNDMNGNGIIDVADTNGIAGSTVVLVDSNGTVVATTVVDATGAYVFTNLLPGAYTVVETNAAGFYSTSDQVGANDDQIPVTVVSGQTSSGNLFLDTAPATISGTVLNDINGNGVLDVADTNGIAGSTVVLVDSNGTVVATTVVDATGAYSFTNLTPGAYTVVETNAAGFYSTGDQVGANDDQIPVTVVSGQTSGGNLFLDTAPATISGSVLNDMNGNGVLDVADTNGIAGSTVVLVDSNGTVVATTVVDATGAYSFTNLAPAAYTVVETNLSGFYSTGDQVGANDDQIPVTVVSGQISSGNDFLDTTPATISGSVLNDINGNGVVDASDTNGIAGSTVVLVDSNGTVVATTVVDATGAYVFTNLAPAAYTVVETNASGFYSTGDQVGANDDQIPVTVVSGQTSSGNLFLDTAPATISGSVLNDMNGNGVLDVADTNGIAGSTVVLVDSNGTVVATTVVDATGAYSFTNLTPGAYTVVETNAAGFYSTSDQVGANDDQIPVTVVSGQTSSGNLFLDTAPVTFGDTIWVDVNGNGLQDLGEPGLPNVTVTLYGIASNVVATVLTDMVGTYHFANIPPGTYAVGVLPPAGYLFTLRNATNDVGVDSNPDRSSGLADPITLTSGQSDVTIDAGLYQPAVIGGMMWWDLDTNGVYAAGEGMMTNVLVTLRDATNGLVATTRTGTNGVYAFTNLVPGTYTVGFSYTNGWYFSPTNGTNNAALDSDANPLTGITAPVTVVSGETNMTLNAGVFVVGSLGQVVWVDVNKDGIPNENLYKYGLNGVRVSLFRILGISTNFIGTTVTTNQIVGVTTNNGYFNFTNLPFGVYLVTVSNGVPANLSIKTTPPSYLINVGYQSIILNANFGYMYPPLPITLKSFSAAYDGIGVRVAWETGVELDNLGFNVYRSASVDGSKVKLNGSLIVGMGNSQGQWYELRDIVPDTTATWYYWLEDVSFKFEAELHGPAVLRAAGLDNQGVIGSFAVPTSGLSRISYSVMQASGLPVATLDPAQLKVQVAGQDVAVYVSAAGSVLTEGDSILFYAPAVGTNHEYTVSLGTNSLRMKLVYARPSLAPGEVWAGVAENGKMLDFVASTNFVRYLIVDFLKTPVWVMDVTDPIQSKLLYGFSTLQPGSNGLSGIYLSYPGVPFAACTAVGDQAVYEVPAIRKRP